MSGAPLRSGIIPADAGSTPTNGLLALSSMDHPRGCGEHDGNTADTYTGQGLSPRMRGARSQPSQSILFKRIIPADAGTTRPVESGLSHCEDHPRGCGEHGRGYYPDFPKLGSSPRMRGAQTVVHRDMAENGIIPADAGSTPPSRKPSTQYTDHPRGCGEHYWCTSGNLYIRGSSPRMRGALNLIASKRFFKRIIPADAGSTIPPCSAIVSSWDHPRGCGEHIGSKKDIIGLDGSSPRMRGAPLNDEKGPAQSRIIPADAGSTTSCFAPPDFRPGSSPRMRGARMICGRLARTAGIIPADAGSTGSWNQQWFQLEDHPRGCGEHLSTEDRAVFLCGSSPRMRGARKVISTYEYG